MWRDSAKSKQQSIGEMPAKKYRKENLMQNLQEKDKEF